MIDLLKLQLAGGAFETIRRTPNQEGEERSEKETRRAEQGGKLSPGNVGPDPEEAGGKGKTKQATTVAASSHG